MSTRDDYHLAERMLQLWKDVREEMTGTPRQREVGRMLKVLEYVRAMKGEKFNG